MTELAITAEEIGSGTMTAEHLAEALYALQTEGFVVLKDIVETAHLDILREKMLADVDAILAREDAPYNFNIGNVQQDPPPFPPYLFKDILVNEMVIAVTRALLGAGVKNAYYSGNTCLKSDKRQPPHADVGHLWAHMPVATPAFGVVVNVPVVDMDARNGSTEIWPGSHLDTTVSIDGSISVPTEVVEERRRKAPPFQPAVRRGSVLIRDIRLWHAGMPNHTDTPRPMIAMIHWARWWEISEPLRFPRGTELFFQHPVLRTQATFVEGPIDYIHHNEAYDFQRDTK